MLSEPLPELVSRAEVLKLLQQLKEDALRERRQFLVDGRQIEAAACSIKTVGLDAAVTIVKGVQRRG